MAGYQQAAQLPFIWLLSDVVWVVIGYLATGTSQEGETRNREPLVHSVILSNSARQAGLFVQWKKQVDRARDGRSL
jgi:hypothetical protein